MRPSPQVPPLAAAASKVSKELRGLNQYLTGRYADRVVLSFQQIEDLTGGPLPHQARTESWWDNAVGEGVPSRQSAAWTEASRTARLNLVAQNVTFDRRPER